MKIQPVTTKVNAAYPMLAKAAALTAIAAASLVSSSCGQEAQPTAGVTAQPPSQDGKNDSATPAPGEEEQDEGDDAVMVITELTPEPPPLEIQHNSGSVIVIEEVEKQEQGGDVEDEEYFGSGED